MVYQAAGPAYALMLGVLLFGASGVGRLLLAGRAASLTPVRQAMAEYVMGMLPYFVLFGVIAEIDAPLWLAQGAIVAFVVTGLVGTWHSGVAWRLTIAAVAILAALIAGITPVNLGAVDPNNYAYIATSMFRNDWV